MGNVFKRIIISLIIVLWVVLMCTVALPFLYWVLTGKDPVETIDIWIVKLNLII